MQQVDYDKMARQSGGTPVSDPTAAEPEAAPPAPVGVRGSAQPPATAEHHEQGSIDYDKLAADAGGSPVTEPEAPAPAPHTTDTGSPSEPPAGKSIDYDKLAADAGGAPVPAATADTPAPAAPSAPATTGSEAEASATTTAGPTSTPEAAPEYVRTPERMEPINADITATSQRIQDLSRELTGKERPPQNIRLEALTPAKRKLLKQFELLDTLHARRDNLQEELQMRNGSASEWDWAYQKYLPSVRAAAEYSDEISDYVLNLNQDDDGGWEDRHVSSTDTEHRLAIERLIHEGILTPVNDAAAKHLRGPFKINKDKIPAERTDELKSPGRQMRAPESVVEQHKWTPEKSIKPAPTVDIRIHKAMVPAKEGDRSLPGVPRYYAYYHVNFPYFGTDHKGKREAVGNGVSGPANGPREFHDSTKEGWPTIEAARSAALQEVRDHIKHTLGPTRRDGEHHPSESQASARAAEKWIEEKFGKAGANKLRDGEEAKIDQASGLILDGHIQQYQSLLDRKTLKPEERARFQELLDYAIARKAAETPETLADFTKLLEAKLDKDETPTARELEAATRAWVDTYNEWTALPAEGKRKKVAREKLKAVEELGNAIATSLLRLGGELPEPPAGLEFQYESYYANDSDAPETEQAQATYIEARQEQLGRFIGIALTRRRLAASPNAAVRESVLEDIADGGDLYEATYDEVGSAFGTEIADRMRGEIEGALNAVLPKIETAAVGNSEIANAPDWAKATPDQILKAFPIGSTVSYASQSGERTGTVEGIRGTETPYMVNIRRNGKVEWAAPRALHPAAPAAAAPAQPERIEFNDGKSSASIDITPGKDPERPYHINAQVGQWSVMGYGGSTYDFKTRGQAIAAAKYWFGWYLNRNGASHKTAALEAWVKGLDGEQPAQTISFERGDEQVREQIRRWDDNPYWEAPHILPGDPQIGDVFKGYRGDELVVWSERRDTPKHPDGKISVTVMHTPHPAEPERWAVVGGDKAPEGAPIRNIYTERGLEIPKPKSREEKQAAAAAADANKDEEIATSHPAPDSGIKPDKSGGSKARNAALTAENRARNWQYGEPVEYLDTALRGPGAGTTYSGRVIGTHQWFVVIEMDKGNRAGRAPKARDIANVKGWEPFLKNLHVDKEGRGPLHKGVVVYENEGNVRRPGEEWDGAYGRTVKAGDTVAWDADGEERRGLLERIDLGTGEHQKSDVGYVRVGEELVQVPVQKLEALEADEEEPEDASESEEPTAAAEEPANEQVGFGDDVTWTDESGSRFGVSSEPFERKGVVLRVENGIAEIIPQDNQPHDLGQTESVPVDRLTVAVRRSSGRTPEEVRAYQQKRNAEFYADLEKVDIDPAEYERVKESLSDIETGRAQQINKMDFNRTVGASTFGEEGRKRNAIYARLEREGLLTPAKPVMFMSPEWKIVPDPRPESIVPLIEKLPQSLGATARTSKSRRPRRNINGAEAQIRDFQSRPEAPREGPPRISRARSGGSTSTAGTRAIGRPSTSALRASPTKARRPPRLGSAKKSGWRKKRAPLREP
jgi:plastocyanin